MYFYDILLLYKEYEDFVEEENKEQEKQQAEYEEKYSLDNYKDNYDFKSQASDYMSANNLNVGEYNFDNLSSGFNF